MKDNPLVSFLAAYGPTPDGNNMYDEFVVAAAQQAGLAQIQIPEDNSRKIIDNLNSDLPLSTILTGTAGDGKTYTARKVLSELSENSRTKSISEPVVTIETNGRRIVFVKDLSEVSDRDKAELIPSMLAAFSRNSASTDRFVVCANDGHLLKTWRDHAGDSTESKAILSAFRLLLKDDRDEHPDYLFRLINMSRRSHADMLDDIVDAICDHEAWELCPSDCEGLSSKTRCPILANRDEFRKRHASSLRNRLKSLIEIAAADDEHLSMRQIMILVVNAMLGDTKNANATPVLNCNRARIRAKNDERAETNPFNNIFGENFPITRRRGFTAFTTLARFEIGYETNNHFDDTLLMPAIISNEARASIDHPLYGERIFSQTKENYNENPESGIDQLRKELVAQRRRLFFTLPDTPDGGDRETSPWLLTVYHYGDMYRSLLSKDQTLIKKCKKKLLQGLNRALTSSFTETSKELWLTQPSGVYRGVDVPLLVGQPIGWKGGLYHLSLEPPLVQGRQPSLNLIANSVIKATLPITPTLFEYLLRVSDGALPTSFGSQCFQDIRNFQIRCVGIIQKLTKENGLDIEYVAVRTLGERLDKEPIRVLEDDV